jgi:hypothetical protein
MFGPKITAFLAAIRVMPNVKRAAKAAGIHRSQHYAKLQSSLEYRAAFDACLAIGFDALSDTAVERAEIGWEEPLVYKGRLTYPDIWDEKIGRFIPNYDAKPLCVRKIDNQLLQFVLKNRHPEYQERKEAEAAAPETAEKITYQWVPRSTDKSNISPSTPKLDSMIPPVDSKDSPDQ